MRVAEVANECRACVQCDSPHCDRVQRHHCRGGRTPSWHMAVGPSPLHRAVQARSHFHTRPNMHRQTEGDWVSLKYHRGLRLIHAADSHTLQAANVNLLYSLISYIPMLALILRVCIGAVVATKNYFATKMNKGIMILDSKEGIHVQITRAT